MSAPQRICIRNDAGAILIAGWDIAELEQNRAWLVAIYRHDAKAAIRSARKISGAGSNTRMKHINHCIAQHFSRLALADKISALPVEAF